MNSTVYIRYMNKIVDTNEIVYFKSITKSRDYIHKLVSYTLHSRLS